MSFYPLPRGTQLQVETCFGDRHIGEVVSYEQSAKILILRCQGKDSKSRPCHNHCIINLNFCKDLSILMEAQEKEEDDEEETLYASPAGLNLQRLDNRLQQSVAERESLLRSRSEEITTRGREIFTVLAKHFGLDKLAWRKKKIVVMQQLNIVPPYGVCNIFTTKTNEKLLSEVQCVVQTFNESLPEATGNQADMN